MNNSITWRVTENKDRGSLLTGDLKLAEGDWIQIDGEANPRRVTYVMGTDVKGWRAAFAGQGPVPEGQVRWRLADPLEPLRKLCLALPETTERLSHGEPTWFIRGKKTFVMYADHHHDDRLAFWCAAPDGAQEVLVAEHPDRFFVPPYVGHRGWLGVYLDVPVDWDEIADLVAAAYRAVAPKRLLAELDAMSSAGGNPTRSA